MPTPAHRGEPRRGGPVTIGPSGPAPYIPLPAGLADPRAAAAAVFDRIASLYDRARPSYPQAATTDLQEICRVNEASRILEIGCGTGQLTREMAGSGAQILCLEPGTSLAALSRERLATWPNVEVLTSSFEALRAPEASFDVVTSATAFHWIDPKLSFAKAARLLRAGGHLALLTNAHSAGGTDTDDRIRQPIRDLHRRLAPEIGLWEFPEAEDLGRRAMAGGDLAAVWARVERKLGEPPAIDKLFGEPTVRVYPWLASYDRQGYLAMLASQSSYALMEPDRRDQLLTGIGTVIDTHLGGTITKKYVTILAVAPLRR